MGEGRQGEEREDLFGIIIIDQVDNRCLID